MFVPVQQRDGQALVYVNTDHIRVISDEGEAGARITFANGGSDLTIDKTSTAKLLGKLEVTTYKAR